MKVNLNTISQRAREILNTPQFLNTTAGPKFEVDITPSDKILTVTHRSQQEEVAFIFNDVLCLFGKNKAPLEIWRISFREVESFLRDENHLPAFQENTSDLEETFYNCKLALLAAVYRTKLLGIFPRLQAMLDQWEELTLVAKNQWAQEFLSVLGWELVLCETHILSITGAPSELPAEVFERLAGEIFERGRNLLPMKVVAV